MTRSTGWQILLGLVILLLIVPACRTEDDPDPDVGPTPDAIAPLKSVTVTIGEDGSFSPSTIAPNPQDTVRFVAQGQDVVLCVDPASLFGAERYAIASGTALDLTVNPEAVNIDFGYSACLGDLEAACGGCRGEEGGGRTGP